MFSVPIYYKQLFELTIPNHWKSIFSSFSKQKMINNNNELTTTTNWNHLSTITLWVYPKAITLYETDSISIII